VSTLLLCVSVAVCSITVCNHCGIVTRRTGCFEGALVGVELASFLSVLLRMGPKTVSLSGNCSDIMDTNLIRVHWTVVLLFIICFCFTDL